MKRLFGVAVAAGAVGLMQPVFGDVKGRIADEPVKLPERRWTTDVEYVAHQGEEGLAPSHSRPAYAFAVEHGLERIKLDLQETKDGEVVLQHDATLKATMGWNVKIKDVTLAEIREKGRCKSVGGFRGETIVTLAEALEYGKKTKKGVWLDFKNFSPAFMKKVFSICEAAGLPHDRIMIATWTKPALRYAKSRYPDVARVAHTWIRRKPDGSGFTTNSGEKDKVYATEDELVAELLRHRDELKLTGFNLPHIVRKGRVVYHTTEKVVRALKAAGCWVSIWFVDDPFTGELYRNFGADCFVTSWAARTKRDFVETPDCRDKINWNRVDVKGWPEAEAPAAGKPQALDANDDSRPAEADARTFPARRIFPIDPELSNVDPATGSLTFYVPDLLAGEAWTLVATLGGREVRQPLGADRRASVRFGAIPEGKYALKVRLLDAADGRELLANDYPVRVRARPTMPPTAKRLNNFVWELGEFPVKEGKVSFDNPRDGWVFLRSGTYETMRYFPCGPCAFKVPGKKCLVRLVKELDKGGVELSEVGSPFRSFTLDFYRKWIFGSFNMYSGPIFPDVSDTTSVVARAYRELRERGARVHQGARMRVGDHALFGDVGKMLALMEGVGGKGRRDALGVDEMRMDLKGVNNRNLGDACWRYLEKHGYEEPIYACWCNVIDNAVTLPEEVAPSLSAVVHSGNGRGFILPEHYLCARNNRGSAEREIEMVVRFSRSLRRLMPTAPSHVSYLFGAYLIPGDWTSWCSPGPDMKAYFTMFMRRLATDPEFADVGGASFSRYYCDEEIARFSAALVRYYCIEGRTDDLNEKLGYRYFPGYVNNGDFEKEFRGWTAEAAADGSLTVSARKDYGRRTQHRIGGGKCGDTFALFVRSADRPNRLRRKVTGLKPGKKYSLSFVTADYDDLLKPGTRPTNTVFHATLANVEVVPEKSYVSVWPPEYFSKGGRRQTRTITLGHKIVFKALGPETEIVFSDWKDDSVPGDRIGERRLLNNVGFYPYFDEDTSFE